ncbi:hypothetical protein HJC23_005981 [Cyclotella cryptica]|uniref:Peptidase S1 domain-containing protein n=1 Tax=Cyclotella cryptica TaxID=29204 RepID=A0ABD3NU42_9STRA
MVWYNTILYRIIYHTSIIIDQGSQNITSSHQVAPICRIPAVSDCVLHQPTNSTNLPTMNLHLTLITLSALLAWTGLASASNMFRGDGNEDANQNIVGGIEATIGRYNYTVALAYVANSFQFCGGSLIAPDIVLTAAHCVGGANFKVVIGRHDLKTSSGEEIVRKSEIRHPQYNGNTMVNDFAIVTLSRPTALDVRYVKLNGDAAFPAGGATSRTMGWGRIKQGGSASSVLREVDLPIITNDVCYQKYSGDIFDSMICTFQPGKDSCQGDSGGPLIIPGSSADTDTLVGIVSWGIGCATNQYPGVYSRVSNGYDWIKTNVCSLSAFPPSDLCGPSATANPTAGSLPTTSPPTNNNQPTTKPPTNKPTNKLPTNKPSKAPRTNKPTKPPKNKPSPVSHALIPLVSLLVDEACADKLTGLVCAALFPVFLELLDHREFSIG